MQAGSSKKIIFLKGSYPIDRASDLARELTVALGQSPILLVDISAVEDLDLSAVQILYAAAASAVAKGGELRFVGSVSSALCSRLVAAGFSTQGPLSGDEFALRLPGFRRAAK